MKEKRCTKALVERSKFVTNLCYQYAIKLVHVRNNLRYVSLDEFKSDLSIYKFSKSSKEDIESRYDNFDTLLNEVNDEYLIQVCKLPTKNLEEILLAHDKKKFQRAPKTLEVIKIELATRGLLL